MTFQPPPPPQGPQGSPGPQGPPNVPPQGPPPAGQWGPPLGSQRPGAGSFDPKTVNQLDWGILAAGVLAFIFSLFDYYTVSVSYRGIGGGSASESAWHGFFGWFAALVALIGAAVVCLELFMPHVKLPFPNRLVALAAFALATLCVILALFVIPIDTGGFANIDTGHGFGYWVSLVVIIAGLVLSFMRFQQTGGQLPIGGGAGRGLGGSSGSGGHSVGSHGVGGQGTGGYSAPAGPPPGAAPAGPPPGYAPPQQPPPPPPGYAPPQQGQPGQQPPPPPSH